MVEGSSEPLALSPLALSPIKIDLILVPPGFTSWRTTTGSLALHAYLVLREPAAAHDGWCRFFDSLSTQRLRPCGEYRKSQGSEGL
jgi:cupin superfamily acireductone dioxygenase involved in methionine salvage